MFEKELVNCHDQGDIYYHLQEVRGKACEAVSQVMATLDPIVTVEARAVRPSIVWAHSLYGDANQATQLIERNRISHPSFMPIEFEARVNEQ
jgi:prophage DNA circulation protein